MLFAQFEEPHVDERLEQDLALCFVDPDWELHCVAFFADYFDSLGFVLQLFAFIFDFGSHGEPGCDFGLLGVEDFEILVVRFLNSDARGLGGEISYFDSYLIILVDFYLLEHYFRRHDL